MSLLEVLARAEHALRPTLSALPPKLATRLFSAGRTAFSKRFAKELPAGREIRFEPTMAWGLKFQAPLWNAAGMFKSGEGYAVVSRQGAGAYVAGTTTSRPRTGNVLDGIRWPAAVYARSHSASNWMGLPNEGHAVVAQRLARLERVPGCPIGASVSAQQELDEATALQELIDGLVLYERAGVDYLELNESCPNVEGHAGGPVLDAGLLRRLHVIRDQFLRTRRRPLPVVVKFSTDTELSQVPELIRTLIELEFDGVILGNTSTRYAQHRTQIHPADLGVYDHFTQTFGGGLSGAVVKADALALATEAVRVVRSLEPHHEFHVIRCGGIASATDLLESQRAGILLNQWYTGYYEAFARHGHDLYESLSVDLQ